MLSSVLLSKLRPELRLMTATDLDMESLLETFEQELIARERANNPTTNPNRHVRNLDNKFVLTALNPMLQLTVPQHLTWRQGRNC